MIYLKNVSKTYRVQHNVVHAVKDVSLELEAGQIFGLLGHNGAGKTTLIKMMCGLVEPTQGEIRIDGIDLLRDRRRAMSKIGVVLEGTRNIYWRLNADQNLKYFAGLKGLNGQVIDNRSEQLLKELDLWDRRSVRAALLSRGMQQKLAIACAFVGDPQILLLDEPTLGLDMESAGAVKSWLAGKTRNEGRTVVLTTHQFDIAQQLCDRVAVLRQGKLVRESTLTQLSDVLDSPVVEVTIDSATYTESAGLEGWDVTGSQAGSMTLRSGDHGKKPLDAIAHEISSTGIRVLAIRYVNPSVEDIYVAAGEGDNQ